MPVNYSQGHVRCENYFHVFKINLPGGDPNGWGRDVAVLAALTTVAVPDARTAYYPGMPTHLGMNLMVLECGCTCCHDHSSSARCHRRNNPHSARLSSLMSDECEKL